MLTAAFPKDGGGNMKYLYLAWNDSESNDIYTSILQNWDYDVDEGAWFTRPISIFNVHDSSDLTTRGVTFYKNYSTSSVRYVFTEYTSNYAKYKVTYTLY